MSKIIGIGFHKTGTTSLHAALELLGYNVCGARLDLADSLLKGDIEQAIQLARPYQALEDNPWPVLYKELDHAYPGSKFILTKRAEEYWLNSVLRHFGTKHSSMRQWIYGKPYPLGNETIYLERYRQHLQEVTTYFENRKEDLLVIDWSNGNEWASLCSFLDVDQPDIEFPHLNQKKEQKSLDFKGKMKDFLEKFK